MPNFVGVDIETTGLNPDENHRLIQIGFAFDETSRNTWDVKPEGSMAISQEALDINGFTLSRIDLGVPQKQADGEISNWLTARKVEKGSLIAVGFNVGAFDLRFIHKELPLTGEFFSHRTVDLATVCFLLGEVQKRDWRLLKDEIRAETARRMGPVVLWHDAGYDAQAAMVSFKVMQDMLAVKVMEGAHG